MLKAADRLKAAIEYGEFRQLPIRSAQCLTYTTSIKEVQPKSALETLIRHFTDSTEKKRERQAVDDAKADQLRMAQMQSRDARDYSVVRDRIARDLYRATGVREKDVAPSLNRDQIAELKKYADTLSPFSVDRREFNEGDRHAERLLRLESQEVSRNQADPLRGHHFSARTLEQSPQTSVGIQRSDRDSYSRGR